MVTILSSHMVFPTEATPNCSLLLSDSEQINAHTHALTIYIYKANQNQNPDPKFPNMIETMRDSLGKILVHYYPLAGRLRLIGGGRLEVDCSAKGVKLLEAESTMALEEYGDFEPNETIAGLIPKVDYREPMEELPLLLVQLTRFTCGGFCVSIAISNVIVDGIAGTLFVNSWAKLARGGTLGEDDKPFIHQIVLRSEAMEGSHHRPNGVLRNQDTILKQRNFVPEGAPSFEHKEFKPLPQVLGNSNPTLERKKETSLTMMKLTREMVENLKKKANIDESTVVKRKPYSRYESIAAHIWRCACKARYGDYNQPTVVCIVAGTRNRLKPPIPLNYFGNATHPTVTPTCLSGDIMSQPLSYGAQKLREAIEVLTDEYLKSAFNFIETQHDVRWLRSSFNSEGCVETPFLGNPNLNIWSWMSNMPMYGPDFGWGKPMYMGPGAVSGDGKAFIMPGPLGDGSLIIAIRLQTAHMESFKKFFYEDI